MALATILLSALQRVTLTTNRQKSGQSFSHNSVFISLLSKRFFSFDIEAKSSSSEKNAPLKNSRTRYLETWLGGDMANHQKRTPVATAVAEAIAGKISSNHDMQGISEVGEHHICLSSSAYGDDADAITCNETGSVNGDSLSSSVAPFHRQTCPPSAVSMKNYNRASCHGLPGSCALWATAIRPG